ncbi:MAG TPA: AsmA family protein, partial [Gammaproteobacteria bacterium]|nr:AsmA family protein [Gammaproteobacteria bacterium]
MKRLLKWISGIVGVLIISVVAIVLTVTVFVRPDQFKPLIITQMKNITGFEMEIPGKLSWSLIPHMGIQADQVIVRGPGVFNAKIKNLVLRVRFLPLLHKELDISKVSMQEIQFNQLLANNAVARVHLNKQMLSIEPVKADFYEGDLRSDASISFNQSPPVLHLAGGLRSINIAAVMKGLSGRAPKLNIDGKGNVTLDITTQGKRSDELLSKLNGTGKFNLDRGALRGVDIGYYMDTAVALVNKQPLPAKGPEDKTEFGQLTGTATIKDGIVHSNDLVLDAPRYVAKGSGTVNLTNNTIDYTLLVNAKPGQKEKVLAL